MPTSTGPFPSKTLTLSNICTVAILILHHLKLFIIMNCYIFPQSNRTQHMFCKTQLIPQKFACPPVCHYQVFSTKTESFVLPPKFITMFTTDFVTICQIVQNFKCYRQTETQGHTNNMTNIKLPILEILLSQTSKHYAHYNTENISVCAPASYVEPVDQLLRVRNLQIWKSPQRCVSSLQGTTTWPRREFEAVAKNTSFTSGA